MKIPLLSDLAHAAVRGGFVADDDGADAGESETRAPDSAVSSTDEEDAEEENPAVDEEMLSAAGADKEDVAAQGAGMEQMA